MRNWLLKIKYNFIIYSNSNFHTFHSVLKKDTSTPLSSVCAPSEVESGWYDWWESNGHFTPSVQQADTIFTMLLPPPNVTGQLHLGHALTCTIQDIIIRWRRMNGQTCIWVPGSDHAGIATQVVVEKSLWAQHKLSRHQLGKDSFLDEVWVWKREKGDQIYHQLRRLGASLDWSRTTFTMDPAITQSVQEAFIRLFDSGLLYRSNSLVNWCCHLQSAISDDEVHHRLVEGSTKLKVPGHEKEVLFGVMMEFAYKLCDADDTDVTVATTRPETMLGDTAVAVHPDDHRYRHLHGRWVWHPLREVKIPVVCDAAVNPEFGTGVVKVTPGHDVIDFDISQRHNLPALNVITDTGHITDACRQFSGLNRFDAREAVLDDLTRRGLFRGQRDHIMQVPICSRTGDVIEKLIKPQWFVRCSEMAMLAAEAVRRGELKIIPPNYQNVWFEWLDNCRDWCVSRQLWWGHRIPAYNITTNTGSQWIVARSEDEALQKMDVSRELVSSIKQDTDVLDTWFSSALLPFAVFGWPQQTTDLNYCYPLNLMETGHDIVFFWAARMVMLGQQLTGQLPFKELLLHGMVCDSKRRKMSKSLGNVLDPVDIMNGISLQSLHDQLVTAQANGYLSAEEVRLARLTQQEEFPDGIPECGADALRFALCSHNFKTAQINVDITNIRHARNFCNKIWQASRFTLGARETTGKEKWEWRDSVDESRLVAMDRWILSRVAALVEASNEHFSKYDFHLAAQTLHDFLYSNLCSVYMESIKPRIKSDVSSTCITVLNTSLHTFLRALHPIMPFITEELHHRLHRADQSLHSIHQLQYPSTQEWGRWRNEQLESDVDVMLGIISAIGSLKSSLGLVKFRLPVLVTCNPQTGLESRLRPLCDTLNTLGKCGDVSIESADRATPPPGSICKNGDGWSAYLLLEDSVDTAAALKSLNKQLSDVESRLKKLNSLMTSHKYHHKTWLSQLANLDKRKLLEAELDRLMNLEKTVLHLTGSDR